jgi:serine/threonine-protein kinase HipA
MAGAAGIQMADLEILESAGGYAHLLITRFDIGRQGERLHQHTLGGLLHIDYNDAGASSYEEYLRTVLRLGLPPAAVEQAYRRMVFNVVAVNQDDHVKNLSFQMTKEGAWRLAPAYDLTFAKGTGFTRQHQMRVADKRSGITRQDLLGVGRAFAVKGAGKIIEETIEIVTRWPAYATTAGVPDAVRRQIANELEERRKALG